MKHLSKLFALLMSLCMVLSLGVSAFASGEPSAEPSGEASGETKSVEDAFIEYIHEWLIAEDEINDNMDENIRENEFMPLVREMNFTDFPAEMIYSGMLEQGVPMTFEEFAAQYVPEDDASAEPSGEASDEAVWDAYVEYLHDYLINVELPVNTNGMTVEIIENEFMPLIREGKFEEPPAVLLFNGLLGSGVAMTFEEFAAQYQPAAGAGDTSEEAYHAYLKEYVDAVPAVDDEAFQVFSALIDASDYTTMPADMMFDPQWWGYSAMTYDEFVAAGGVYEIPAFDPNLRPD